MKFAMVLTGAGQRTGGICCMLRCTISAAFMLRNSAFVAGCQSLQQYLQVNSMA
jgi:hypothetical protein